MAHHFHCGNCGFAFEIKDGDDSYNDDPQTRDCPECKSAKGNIMYLGCSGVALQVIGDYINGAGGALKSMADGKMYDSKSAYYKAVKAAGCEIMGNDAPREAKPMEYKINERELKSDIAQSIQQLGG